MTCKAEGGCARELTLLELCNILSSLKAHDKRIKLIEILYFNTLSFYMHFIKLVRGSL